MGLLMAEEKKEIFTMEEAAEYLRISRPTLKKLVDEGKIKRVPMESKRYLFDYKELRRFVEGR